MISYEVSLFKTVSETLHAKVSVEAGTPEEARLKALEQADDVNVTWTRYLGERQESGDARVEEIEAIVDLT